MICGSASFAGFLTLLLLVGCLVFFFACVNMRLVCEYGGRRGVRIVVLYCWAIHHSVVFGVPY
jgi:hypothetical protein